MRVAIPGMSVLQQFGVVGCTNTLAPVELFEHRPIGAITEPFIPIARE
jgi:hypothetical protein